MAVLSAALKTLFSLLACVMAVALVYGFVKEFMHFDPNARWSQVALIDFCMEISFIAAWFFYKESRWIPRVVFIVILFWFGSFIVCGYIVIQLFKLSPEESSKDPIYFVLVTRQKSEATRRVSVVTARITFISIGCLMLGILVFVFTIDGSPFRAQILTPIMITSLVDLSILAVIFSVWVTYKESNWINAFVWVLLIICFGSITMCGYITRELFYLSPKQPVFLILFNKNNRDLMLSDPLLMEHGNA